MTKIYIIEKQYLVFGTLSMAGLSVCENNINIPGHEW